MEERDALRRTKIVITLGPATASPERIRELVAAGMDVARLNFSHGTHDDHAHYAATVRAEAARAGRCVGILADLQGPKIRTGPLKEAPVRLEPGQTFTITTDPAPGDAERVSTTYPGLAGDVRPGDRLLISDGLMEMRVERTTDTDVVGTIVYGGELRPFQGINLPGVAVSAPSLTDKDRADLAFALSQPVDYVAISFVRRVEDVHMVKEAIAGMGRQVPVVTKLEKPEALAHLDAILAASDGVMVARGDLGVEMSPEEVPYWQKAIIAAANRAAVPVITATQMLESMIENSQPTRAEVSDVANAILDGSDAVMLSGETAIGRHPIRATEMMVRIATTIEASAAYREATPPTPWAIDRVETIPEAIGAAVSAIGRSLPVTAFCVLTKTGSSARIVSHFRPGVPILAFTPVRETYHRLSLLWGVTPLMTALARDEDEYYRQVQDLLLTMGYAQEGDTVVVTGGHPVVQGGPTNFLKILTVSSS